MKKEEKSFHQLERIVRGFSNHRRIQILELLAKSSGLSVVEISSRLKINFKTAAEHIRRLAITGMVLKRSDGHSVRHKISERGGQVLEFLRTLE